jgi:hypothetical protein
MEFYGKSSFAKPTLGLSLDEYRCFLVPDLLRDFAGRSVMDDVVAVGLDGEMGKLALVSTPPVRFSNLVPIYFFHRSFSIRIERVISMRAHCSNARSDFVTDS